MLRTAINDLWARIEFRNIQGVVSSSGKLSHQLTNAYYYTHSPYEALTDNDQSLLQSLERQTGELAKDFQEFADGAWRSAMDAGPDIGAGACALP
jgi:hypothetical protein